MLPVNENRMMKFEEAQRQHVANLRELMTICDVLKPKGGPKGMKDVEVILRFVANSLKVLIAKHVSARSPRELQPGALFVDVEILDAYKDVLFGSAKLIFNNETCAFRTIDEPNFTRYVVSVYCALTEFHRLWAAETLQLKSIIHAFQYQFGSNYNVANCSILNLNQVHDLLSPFFDLISPPLLNIQKVAKRDYFHLTVEKFGYRSLLVEIFQLSSGELAVFKVNCGELPSPASAASRLLQRLADGEFKLLDLGRTLLFPALREYDLEVVKVIDSGSELCTPTENKVTLRLECVDPIQWESHWKFCFQKLFDKRNVIPRVLQNSTLAPMTKSSHPFQSFKFKHQKLQDLRPNNQSGIAIQMPQRGIDANANEDATDDFNKKSFRLHKSKPLEKALSSLTRESDSKNILERSASDSSILKSPSLRDIEQFSYSKLLELDKTIDMNLAQTKLETPEIKECKSMSQDSSLGRTDPVGGKGIVVSDIESDNDTDSQEELKFNPSADIYKPNFYQSKSSSLLNLFRPKNKKKFSNNSSKKSNNGSSKKLANDSNNDSTFTSHHADSSTSIFRPQSATSSSLSSKSSISSLLKHNNGVELPSDVEMNSENVIFESKIARVSSWNGRLWEPIKSKKLKLTITKSNKGEKNDLVIHEEKDTHFCKLAAHITPQWKCSRSNAQDVQLNIPLNEFMVKTFSTESNFLSIRCLEAERLQNFLQHCIKGAGQMPCSLPSSATAGTLMSAGSSFKSEPLLSMASDLSALKLADSAADTKLLLPNIKINRYSHSDTTMWQELPSNTVDLYVKEYKGLLTAVVFEFFTSGENSDSLSARTNDITRVGTTGMLIICQNEEHFLEFQNRTVTDQVYRLMKSS